MQKMPKKHGNKHTLNPHEFEFEFLVFISMVSEQEAQTQYRLYSSECWAERDRHRSNSLQEAEAQWGCVVYHNAGPKGTGT